MTLVLDLKKGKQDAPNYRDARDGEGLCSGCAYARGSYCALFDFPYDRGYTCDMWIESENDLRMEYVHDSDASAVVLGPPPKPNRREYPFVGCIHFQGILIYG